MNSSCLRTSLVILCILLFLLDFVYLMEFIFLRDGNGSILGMLVVSAGLAALMTAMYYMR